MPHTPGALHGAWSRVLWLCLIAALAAACTVAIDAPVAQAGSNCVTDTVSYTFTDTGGAQCYIMPHGVTQVTIVATGAPGGKGGTGAGGLSGGSGGNGAQLTYTKTLQPGDELDLTVGGPGADGADDPDPASDAAGGAGGFHGGGRGGNASSYPLGGIRVGFAAGGGGGGATVVSGPAGFLMEAGGGGGGGGADKFAYGGNGGCGSTAGDNGSQGAWSYPFTGAEAAARYGESWRGGPQPAGAAGGGSSSGSSGDAGADGDPGGGGGGGGHVGGAAGPIGGIYGYSPAVNQYQGDLEYGAGGGGGGSSYGPSGTTFTSCSTTASSVQITASETVATAKDATSITGTGATLNGTVNPQSSQTSYYFEYVDYSHYAGWTQVPASAVSVGSDNTDHSVSQTITGLEPNHKYQYHIVATNAAGETYTSPGVFFTTQAVAPVVSSLPASSLTGSSATLNGTVNPKNSQLQYLYFEYGTVATFDTAHDHFLGVPLSAGGSDDTIHSISATLSGLQPGTTYRYKFVAQNSGGANVGADETFTTPDVPGAPGSVAATPGDGQATVSFAAPTDYGTPSSYTVTATDQTTAGHGGQTATGSGSPITVTGLTNGDSYTFMVTATNTAGPGLPGGPSTAVTPLGAPGQPTDVQAFDGSADAAVSFTAASSGVISSYRVTASDLTNPANGGQTTTVSASSLYANPWVYVTGLSNGDSYTFTVTAVNPNGTGGPVSAASAAVVPAGPIIRSLSFGGPSGYYVDLYNPAARAITLNGWFLTYGGGVDMHLPGIFTMPAHGDYLVAGTGYSLGVTADLAGRYSNGLGNTYGVRMQAPDNTFSDVVGYSGANATAWRSGTGLTQPTSPSAPGAFERKFAAGVPVNTGDNWSDFVYVSPDVNATNNDGVTGAVMGSPSPADLAAPTQQNQKLPSTLFAPTSAASVSPNRVYNAGAATLTVRRKITNNTGSTLSKLRIQLTSLTTWGSTTASGAVLEPINSPSETVSGQDVAGTTLLTGTNSAGQGGLDSVWSVTLPTGGLPAGQTINVDLVFHVARGGSFSFGYNALGSP